MASIVLLVQAAVVVAFGQLVFVEVIFEPPTDDWHDPLPPLEGVVDSGDGRCQTSEDDSDPKILAEARYEKQTGQKFKECQQQPLFSMTHSERVVAETNEGHETSKRHIGKDCRGAAFVDFFRARGAVMPEERIDRAAFRAWISGVLSRRSGRVLVAHAGMIGGLGQRGKQCFG